MKKAMTILSPVISTCMFMGTYYLLKNRKKNMLDVLIDEIETIK